MRFSTAIANRPGWFSPSRSANRTRQPPPWCSCEASATNRFPSTGSYLVGVAASKRESARSHHVFERAGALLLRRGRRPQLARPLHSAFSVPPHSLPPPLLPLVLLPP